MMLVFILHSTYGIEKISMLKSLFNKSRARLFNAIYCKAIIAGL